MARYVDNLPNLDIPSYTALDVRVGYNPTARVRYSMVGQNLLEPSHPEWTRASELERGVYGKVTWTF